MTATDNASTDFGANAWLVDEMYERYRSDPHSVSDTWQEFFEDYKPSHIVDRPGGRIGAGRRAGSGCRRRQPAPEATAPRHDARARPRQRRPPRPPSRIRAS